MKTCVTCKIEKSLDDFNKRARSKDGRQARCRDCIRKWYKDNKKSHIERVNARSKKVRDILRQYVWERKKGPCADCGQTFHPVAMDFDHIRGEKITDVSKMIAKESSLEDINLEIAKCDLVCANCHRVRTFTRSGLIAI